MVAAGVRSHPNPRHSRHAILHGAGTGDRLARRHCFGGCVQSRRDSLPPAYGSSALCRRHAVIIPKSVAVLPFENLSNDANNAYFADGIQEEILTRLAGIADLKVISRTSTQQYQSKPRNLSQIAKQLGVANILEGSVQKAADQVRVNVQLINAQTDSR